MNYLTNEIQRKKQIEEDRLAQKLRIRHKKVCAILFVSPENLLLLRKSLLLLFTSPTSITEIETTLFIFHSKNLFFSIISRTLKIITHNYYLNKDFLIVLIVTFRTLRLSNWYYKCYFLTKIH